MISIIVCSIQPELLAVLKSNISKTIGVPYEVISIDNRIRRQSIAQVYNHGASQARYDYLFFLHEDVRFLSYNWGGILVGKAQEHNCGLIGFAGAKVKPFAYSGWGQMRKHSVLWLAQGTELRNRYVFHINVHHPFEPVVTIDGFAMFVRKEVWKEFPFDEQLLTGFHCYDLDMSLSVAHNYQNHVCGLVDIHHFSEGRFNSLWLYETMKLHDKKWRRYLPVAVSGYKYDSKEVEEGSANDFLNKAFVLNDVPIRVKLSLLKDFCINYGNGFSHFKHIIKRTVNLLENLFLHVSKSAFLTDASKQDANR